MKNYTKLTDSYAYATECNLATLQELVILKSSSKSRIERQESICLTMLRVCQEYASEIDWGHTYHPNFHRVQRLLEAAKTQSLDLQTTLRLWRDHKLES